MLWEVGYIGVARSHTRFTHLGSLQGHHQNHNSCCETMYLQSNSRSQVIIQCFECCLFIKCGYAKWDWTMWHRFQQFCEGGFWFWIANIVDAYDGWSHGNPSSISCICNYLHYYQGTQHVSGNVRPTFSNL